MRGAYHCQHPGHEGDRRISHRMDIYNERREFVRLDNQKRLASITLRTLCVTCARDEAALAKGQPEMPTLF